ncbi:hypothetical protein DL96DRAFT_1534369 [Flagelloscypha sp. PMI_526]|nr:hypothetical protein DL96DRAFT_1534369 [Flagelloscypha sp. PMI_526]
MGIPPPTKREYAIVFVLAALILYIVHTTGGPDLDTVQLSFPTKSGTADTSSSYAFYEGESSSERLRYPSPQGYSGTLTWDSGTPPETNVIAHAPGWTIFDRLYVFKGVVYVITTNKESVPDTSAMYSKALKIFPGKEAEDERLPDDNDIRIVTPAEAKQIFGTKGAGLIDGLTFLINDPVQFITHYYHWTAELWFGLWRTYSSLDLDPTSGGNTTLPPAKRIAFNHLDNFHWRDYALMNQWVVQSTFPGVIMEFKDDWRDRAELEVPYVYERVVLADRSAAMPAYNYQRYQRTAATAFGLPGTENWWRTVRNNVIMLVGLDASVGGGTLNQPVITYISRQEWGRRMLIPEQHEKLVQELFKLRDTYGYEVNVVTFSKTSRQDQLRLAARTTIMMGVHGNGLTHLVWMNPTPRTTVMEFFYPEGFAHDYEYTTRALGMTHYGWWGSRHFTSPNLPLPAYPPGFQGNEIPIDGEKVAELCVARLSLAEEYDD